MIKLKSTPSSNLLNHCKLQLQLIGFSYSSIIIAFLLIKLSNVPSDIVVILLSESSKEITEEASKR